MKKPPSSTLLATTPLAGEFLLYQAEDGQARIQLRVLDGSVWLTQKQLSELYQVSVPTINGHLRGLYGDGELVAEAPAGIADAVLAAMIAEMEAVMPLRAPLEAIGGKGATWYDLK